MPAESPEGSEVDDVILALAELWVGRALAQALASPDELPFPVESALRTTTSDSLDFGAWLSVFEALLAAGLATDPEGRSELVCTTAEKLGCSPTFQGLVAAAGAGDLPESYVPALGQWLHEQGIAPMCWIRSVEPSDGAALVHFRRLEGTAHPALHHVEVGDPLFEADQLVFWDGHDEVLPLPRWLAHWDPERRQLRWFNGRDPDGHVRYRGWSGLVYLRRMPEDAPIFLRDDALHTPGPGVPPLPSTLPGPTPPGAERDRSTQPMAMERVSMPPVSDVAHPFVDADPLVVRVLTTRYVLRFARLDPGSEVVLGRNSDHANFVLAHHQLSRAHTRIRHRDGLLWVCDMGSTNGTQLNDQPVGREDVPAAPGDVVAAGPVLMRIEHLSEARLQLLSTVTGLRPSEERDPLTRLLLPKHLAGHLPEVLLPTFQEGGPGGDLPSLWGIVLRVDRLHAIHAQLGEAVADAAFAITARLVQGHVDDPLSIVRLGYGEVLVPAVGLAEPKVRKLATRLVRLLKDQPWEPPLTRVTVTAGIGEKQPSEGAGLWISRIRAGMPAHSSESPAS